MLFLDLLYKNAPDLKNVENFLVLMKSPEGNVKAFIITLSTKCNGNPFCGLIFQPIFAFFLFNEK